ncbi:MAG TPA: hypothetical protein VIO57_15290 [Chloroflexota bacterium]|jgi:hypothetical protein
MSKRAIVLSTAMGVVTTLVIASLLIYSIRTGVAPVTIPIFALVLGPALAAAAMVATCSVVAPPQRSQPLMAAIEIDIRPAHVDEPAESTARI